MQVSRAGAVVTFPIVRPVRQQPPSHRQWDPASVHTEDAAQYAQELAIATRVQLRSSHHTRRPPSPPAIPPAPATPVIQDLMATGVIDDIYNNASAVYSYASLNHFAGAAGDDETAWVRHGDS